MIDLDDVQIAQRVERTLNAASSSISEVIWEHLKHLPHDKFVTILEEHFGINLFGDEDVDSIYFHCHGQLVHTPSARAIDNFARHRFLKLKNNKKLLDEIRNDIFELIALVCSPNPRTLIFREVTKIYKKAWNGANLDYPLYAKKKNGNCLLSTLATLNALIAYIAGIDSSSPCDLLTKEKGMIDYDELHADWFSVPAVIMGLNTARKAQLPVPERQMNLMLDMTMKNPAEIATWSDENGIVTGTAIKNFADLHSTQEITCVNYHADIEILDDKLVVTAVYPVDKNGFGFKKRAVSADSNTLREVQEYVNRLNEDIKTSESIKLPNAKGTILANIRKLSLKHDSTASQMKLSVTRFGTGRLVAKPINEKKVFH